MLKEAGLTGPQIGRLQQLPWKEFYGIDTRASKKLNEGLGYRAGFGDKAASVAEAYAKVFPDKKPVEIWSMAISNRKRRNHDSQRHSRSKK